MPATVAAAAGESRKDVSIMDENVIPNEIQTVWAGTAEVARALGVHRQTVLRWIASGTIPRRCLSRAPGTQKWRIKASELWPEIFGGGGGDDAMVG